MQHHNYSLEEMENMMPWEREVYLNMVMEHVKEENKKIEKQQREMNK
tara:strand:- start:294 stop:434 length:141 start_codon:yes stop_codon:yes gene_type:complete